MGEFSKNEALSLMYGNTADALRRIADHIEKYKINWEESATLLREISDEHDAQAIVVNLRDEINPSNT